MKEIFRDPDYSRVLFFQSLLENEGVKTWIGNAAPGFNGLGGPPRAEMFPTLFVVNEEDEILAKEIMDGVRDS